MFSSQDRQCVHIGAQTDRTGLVADPEHADDARTANAAVHLDAEFLELGGDEIRRTLFLETEFRIRVDIPPPAG